MEQFWYLQPKDLFSPDYAKYFFPNKKMTFGQRLNAVLRLSIYFAITMVLLTSCTKFLIIPFIVAAATYLLYMQVPVGKGVREGEVRDSFEEGGCTVPTQQNPFMNVLMNEYTERPDRLKACSVEDRKVKNLMGSYFEKDLFRNVGDIFNNAASDRQYYTTANTQIPNDQAGFAKWLYGEGKTCKEKNGTACARNLGIGG